MLALVYAGEVLSQSDETHFESRTQHFSQDIYPNLNLLERGVHPKYDDTKKYGCICFDPHQLLKIEGGGGAGGRGESVWGKV